MTEATTTTVATPAQMAEAWGLGVMHGSLSFVKEELRAHPPTIADPIYHRDDYEHNGGWHSASGILRDSAIRQMRTYLQRKGLVAPEATEAAWAATEEFQRLMAHIANTCKTAGLGVMEQVYQIVHDREQVSSETLFALTPDMVESDYNNYIGPAIDKIEDNILQDAEVTD